VIGVTWVNTDPLIASARLRSIIPGDILKANGLLKGGADVVVAAKHGWNAYAVRAAFRCMVMDVCDDHFDGPLAGHYLDACSVADVVTCNSREMQRVIRQQTGIDAVVIDDPYEDPEREPEGGDGVLWFGHKSNLKDLEAVAPQIRHPLTIVSNHNYCPESLDTALKSCRAVLIPTGKSLAKSANRAIKAIRYGKYPVCGPMPAHTELGLGTEDIGALLDDVMTHDKSVEIRAMQDAIRARFDPQKVAKDWYRVIYEASK